VAKAVAKAVSKAVSKAVVTEDVADEAGKAQRHAAKRGNEGTRIKGKTELIAKYRKGATSEYMCVPELRPVTVSPPYGEVRRAGS